MNFSPTNRTSSKPVSFTRDEFVANDNFLGNDEVSERLLRHG